METERWHNVYKGHKHHPFLKEKKAREMRMKTMGLFDLDNKAKIPAKPVAK